MTTEIYYFSGTGNSLHVARELQKRIPGAQLIPILSLVNREVVETGRETVGFVFPQYGGTMPKVVARLVKRLDLRSAKYLFAIVTRGGTPCRAFGELDKLLEKGARRLDSFFVVTMPSGSDPLVENYVENITPERIARLEADMLHRLDSIQRIVTAREVNREEDLRGEEMPPPAFMVPFLPLIKLLEPFLLPLAKRVESEFAFYPDSRCTGCGICEKVCLGQKVRMVGGRPEWQKQVKCHGCFACLNFCPEQSIQIRSTWYLKSCTPENGRYHHPAITASDIARQKQ